MGQQQTKQQAKVFHQAVRNGNVEKVAEEIANGVPLDDQDDVFGTALHESVCFNRLEVAELLIKHKVDINAHTFGRNGETALHVAAKKGLLPFVDLLLVSGAKINQTGPSGMTALHLALENGYEEVCKFLVDFGANLAIVDANNSTPLHIACKKAMKGTVPLLASRGGSNFEVYDKFGMTSLMYTAQLGNSELFNELVRNGAKVCGDFGQGKEKEKEKEKDKDKEKHLSFPGRGTPLHVVTTVELAKEILSLHVDLQARDDFGRTSLHSQCTVSSNYPIVELLLSNGSDPNARDKSKSTALHLAASSGCLRNSELLIQYGADVNTLDDTKASALHLASKTGYDSICNLLIKCGADVNAKNSEGLNPSQLAISAED